MTLNIHDKNTLTEYIHHHLHTKIKSSTGWKNFSQNVELTHALVLDIADSTSLQLLVKKINEMNNTRDAKERIVLRAAAGGLDEEYSESYSLTPLIDADVVVRLVGPEFQAISLTHNNNIINVGASVNIGKLDSVLYDKYNLVLPTSSLIPYVTVSGLSATAGHGTGRDQPSFAGLIRAITFCLPNGEIVRIDDTHQNFEAIRSAHLGVFGIVLNMEIACVEAKKMQCVMEARSVAELIDEIRSGLFINDPYVSVMYVPTYQSDELTNRDLKNVVIYRWRPVEKSVNNVNTHSVFSRCWQELEIKLQEGFKITDLLKAEPSVVPYYMMYLVSKLKVGEKDRISVGPWPTTHYQTSFPREINDVDYLFEVGDHGHETIVAIENLVKTLSEFAKNKQYPVTYAAYLRLFQGTNGGLSTSIHGANKHICGFDIVSSPGMPGFESFREKMNEFFFHQLNAKPHWGKYVPEEMDYEKIYGNNYIQFREALQQWHEEHHIKLEKNMLLNGFLCKLLKLPYAPELQANQPNAEKKCQSLLCSREMAKRVLPYIQSECSQADNLRNCLNNLASSKVSEAKQSLFQAPVTIAKNTKKKRKKSCCVII
ncbi:FAD-binding protein [Aquicella lusitana]|uniref:FAD binding domain-containing protein n=1 Tax=Aquicella lusitana TaxID=254246 RepID=A0A370GJ19_9COXI|nr:FAD-binding protein [Aquicella lusitana]RDI43802.1 FAD binding domain-containing protein [Aquicella lusitana]VVC74467.1 hypothetical protein AQULUS_22330 [Aquicella lusitana]